MLITSSFFIFFVNIALEKYFLFAVISCPFFTATLLFANNFFKIFRAVHAFKLLYCIRIFRQLLQKPHVIVFFYIIFGSMDYYLFRLPVISQDFWGAFSRHFSGKGCVIA